MKWILKIIGLEVSLRENKGNNSFVRLRLKSFMRNDKNRKVNGEDEQYGKINRSVVKKLKFMFYRNKRYYTIENTGKNDSHPKEQRKKTILPRNKLLSFKHNSLNEKNKAEVEVITFDNQDEKCEHIDGRMVNKIELCIAAESNSAVKGPDEEMNSYVKSAGKVFMDNLIVSLRNLEGKKKDMLLSFKRNIIEKFIDNIENYSKEENRFCISTSSITSEQRSIVEVEIIETNVNPSNSSEQSSNVEVEIIETDAEDDLCDSGETKPKSFFYIENFGMKETANDKSNHVSLLEKKKHKFLACKRFLSSKFNNIYERHNYSKDINSTFTDTDIESFKLSENSDIETITVLKYDGFSEADLESLLSNSLDDAKIIVMDSFFENDSFFSETITENSTSSISEQSVATDFDCECCRCEN